MNSYGEIKTGIANAIAEAFEACGLEKPMAEEVLKSLDNAKAFGDISSNIILKVAKAKSLDVQNLAEKIVSGIKKPEYIGEINQKNGFINFLIEKNSYSFKVLETVIDSKRIFTSDFGKGKKAIIEYPSINPAHPMHMGQVRNVLLGDAIANLYSFSGYDVEREDYIDDLGLQVAEVIWGLAHLKDIGIEFDQNRKFDSMIGEVYVAVNKVLDRKGLKEEIANILVSMEQDGTYESKTAREMAESFVKAEYETLQNMGIYHNVLVWESDIVRKKLLESALGILEKKGITTVPEEGDYSKCVIIEHSKLEGLSEEFGGLRNGVKVLVRSNGAPNYVAKDIAFHMWKLGLLQNSFSYKKFMEQGRDKLPLYSTCSDGASMDFGGADLAINTIDARQSYEQAVVRFVIAALEGDDYKDRIKHVAYGVVDLEGVSLSGRKGTWVGYTCDDLLREAEEKASKLITDRFRLGENEKVEVAKQISLSAIKYEFLKLSNEKNLLFSWQRALNFEGNSGPYCEYMHARAERILESANEKRHRVNKNYEFSQQEFELIKMISYAGEILEKSAKECKPNTVIEYMTALATNFGKFYESVPILKAEKEEQIETRLAVTEAFKRLMAELLETVGITPVNKM